MNVVKGLQMSFELPESIIAFQTEACQDAAVMNGGMPRIINHLQVLLRVGQAIVYYKNHTAVFFAANMMW